LTGAAEKAISSLRPARCDHDLARPQNHQSRQRQGFSRDFLNIDIDDYWSPDVIADVSGDFPAQRHATYPTKRFRRHRHRAWSVRRDHVHDVLEHVSDLVATMTNCLKLLRVGGVFKILVPYDLSMVPGRTRRISARSMNAPGCITPIGSGIWAGSEHRFVARNLNFAPSPLGEQLIAAGQPQELVLRTPRAIDSMLVILEKIALSAQDRQALAEFTDARVRNQALSQGAALERVRLLIPRQDRRADKKEASTRRSCIESRFGAGTALSRPRKDTADGSATDRRRLRCNSTKRSCEIPARADGDRIAQCGCSPSGGLTLSVSR